MAKKQRGTTIAQRFGFQDPELKTPKHDEMMLWLDENCLEIGQRVFAKYFETDHIDSPIEMVAKKKPFRVISKIWEKTIVSNGYKSKYVVGFGDMYVLYGNEVICGAKQGEVEHADVPDYFFIDSFKEGLWFEVKPTIPSLGELLRQLRMYQEYAKGTWIVVSPDERFKMPLRDQGFGFVKYE